MSRAVLTALAVTLAVHCAVALPALAQRDTPYPLDPLSSAEITHAVDILRTAGSTRSVA